MNCERMSPIKQKVIYNLRQTCAILLNSQIFTKLSKFAKLNFDIMSLIRRSWQTRSFPSCRYLTRHDSEGGYAKSMC